MVTIEIFINEILLPIRMEPLSTYLTKEGWKDDYRKTRFRKFYEVGLVTSSMPVFAGLGSITAGLAGAHIGELVDNHMPLVRDIMPFLIINYGNINAVENLSRVNSEVGELMGFVGGLGAGLIYPWRKYYRNGVKNRQDELMQHLNSVIDSSKKD